MMGASAERAGSPLATAPGSRRFSSAVYERARNKYQPNQIRLLFVAESPPSSGGFFYFAETIGKDHLFRETMKVLGLWPLSKPMVKGLDKRPLLEEFKSRRLFLVDTSPLPVDKFSEKDRRIAIVRRAPRLARKVKSLNPASVIIIKKTVYVPVRKALQDAGLKDRILNSDPLPFPSHGNQRKYRRQLRRLMEIIDRT